MAKVNAKWSLRRISQVVAKHEDQDSQESLRRHGRAGANQINVVHRHRDLS